MRTVIHTDVSLVNGRWRAGWTFRFRKTNAKARVEMRGSRRLIGTPWNNTTLAELNGIHAAITALIELGDHYPRAKQTTILQVLTDSQSSAHLLMNVNSTSRPELLVVIDSIHDLIRYRYKRHWFEWVPRKQNKRADSISREAV